MTEKKAPKPKTGKQRAYRIKLELEFRAMSEFENNKIDRSLTISLKDSEKYFESFEDAFIRQYFADEFDFFSNRCFNDLKIFLALLRREIGFNQVGNLADREELIKNYLRAFEKGLRKRLRSVRGRPKKDFSGDEFFLSDDAMSFAKNMFQAVKSLEEEGTIISKSAVSAAVFPDSSNPLQAMHRRLKRFDLSFDNFVKKPRSSDFDQ